MGVFEEVCRQTPTKRGAASPKKKKMNALHHQNKKEPGHGDAVGSTIGGVKRTTKV